MNLRLDESARGVYPIMATPFTDLEEIDWTSVDRLVDFYLASAVAGITILGIMGEAPKLATDEAEKLVERCLKRTAGRIPLIVGVSNPALKSLRDFSRKVADLGAAAVMVAPVPGLTTEEQVFTYFRAVAGSLGAIPVVVQNYPPANGVFMSVALLNRLFREFPGFKMLKHEEAPGLRKLSQLRAADGERGGRRISIVAGNGAIHLVQELRRGADGVMTGFAFPEMLTGVWQRFVAGERDAAEDLYDAWLPLVRHEQQAGIGLALRKEILRRRGLIGTAKVRAPGPSLDAADHEELTQLLRRTDRALQKLGLRLPALQENLMCDR